MKKILILVFVWVMVDGCKDNCGDEQGLLTPQELAWLPYYNGQVLVFQSDSGKIDTVTVTKSITSYQYGVSENGNCPLIYSAENGKEILNFGSDSLSLRFDISINHNSSPAIIGNYEQFVFSNYSTQNNVTVNNINYNDIYVMAQDTTGWYAKLQNRQKVWKVYYTQQKGLLEFIVYEGSNWVRIH